MNATVCVLLAAVCAALAASTSFAEAVAPELAISGFVKALQNNDEEYLKKYADLDRIKNQPKHGYTVERMKALFAGVEISKMEFSKPVYDEKTKTFRVRMNKPLSFDFELQHQNAAGGKGDFYRITEIHP